MQTHHTIDVVKHLKKSRLKNKLKILLLISGCSVLMGCPPGNYSEYLLVNKNLNKSEFGYHYTLNENIEFKAKVKDIMSLIMSCL